MRKSFWMGPLAILALPMAPPPVAMAGKVVEVRLMMSADGTKAFFEAAGMVGRIIVGKPGTGPGTRPFGYAPEKKWDPVSPAARDKFPAIEEIMRQGMARAAPASPMKH